MPIYPPRDNASKKKQELDYAGFQLYLAVSKGEIGDQLQKVVENFRKANLGLLKLELHLSFAQHLSIEVDNVKIQKLQAKVKYWEDITHESIIENHKTDYFSNYQKWLKYQR